MRFHQLSLRGISEAFRERVQVDFEALGPGLIAIVGENGVGKSTLIGCLFAALFRQLPGQKRPLYDFCTHPESEIDVIFGVNGARYRSLLKINPQARQMESYIFDAAGVAKTSGKKEAFEEFVRRHCGTRELFAASIFSNQKRTGIFLSLDRSQRKELFIRELLGLDRLRLISATAKAYADQAGRRLAELEGERRGIEQLLATATVPDLGKLDECLEDLCSQISRAEQDRRAVESRMEELRSVENQRRALEARRSDLTRQIQRIDGRMAELSRLIEQDRSLIDSAGESNGAAQQAEVVAREIANLHGCIQAVQRVEASNAAVEQTLRAIESELLLGCDRCERAEREAAEIELVPCHGRGEYAGCVKLQRAVEARDQVPELRGSVATLELERTVQRDALVPVPVSSAEPVRQLQRAEQKRRQLETVIKRCEDARVAAARLSERERARSRFEEEKVTLAEEVAALEVELLKSNGISSELEAARQTIAGIDDLLSRLHSRKEAAVAQRAQAEQLLRQIEEARIRAAGVGATIAEARTEKADFEYLAKVFGPDEIQLCEIQSAGPGVSRIVNQLLEGCFENKFEIRFRTQRPRADGKGVVDDFDIEVRNKALDRTCLIDELSGGQFVLVNEAVNLGIAIYNAQQAEGIRYETLFRDETIGALDAKNAKEYIRMLRQAMDLGGFHQVIFICHAPTVWELADRILRVESGRVYVDG